MVYSFFIYIIFIMTSLTTVVSTALKLSHSCLDRFGEKLPEVFPRPASPVQPGVGNMAFSLRSKVDITPCFATLLSPTVTNTPSCMIN